jgi:hypothetical protein
MKQRLAVLLMVLACAACVQQPASPPPAVPEAPTSPPSTAQLAPGHWDVERVRCSDLLEASDADRASAAMFYFGYLAAKDGIQVVDVNRIDANIAKVMQQCEATPTMAVPQAFRQALRPQS